MNDNLKIRSIIIVGCGPHFKARYFPVIKESVSSGNIKIALLIDLHNKKEDIEEFFKGQNFPLPNLFLLPNHFLVNSTFKKIDSYVTSKEIGNADGILICTEPKAHKAYIIWAIKNNLHIFVDKPLTAFNNFCYKDTLYDDYCEIAKAAYNKPLNIVISCERRIHQGYIYLLNYLKDFIEEYHVPLTYIDIHFAGGNWVMPEEFISRENHPFKYGYGVLLHSGYHYIDLLATLLSLNKKFLDFSIKDITLKTLVTYPWSSARYLNNSFYQKIFNSPDFSQKLPTAEAHLGETDIMIMGQLVQKNNIFTNFNLKLLENTLSARSSAAVPYDPYKDTSRLRQDNIIIHLGPLCSIHIRSNPYHRLEENCKHEDFTIEIMTHPTLVNKKNITTIDRAELSNIFPELKITEKLNKKARETQLKEFLNGKDANSSLISHQNSIQLLNKIYQCM